MFKQSLSSLRETYKNFDFAIQLTRKIDPSLQPMLVVYNASKTKVLLHVSNLSHFVGKRDSPVTYHDLEALLLKAGVFKERREPAEEEKSGDQNKSSLPGEAPKLIVEKSIESVERGRELKHKLDIFERKEDCFSALFKPFYAP